MMHAISAEMRKAVPFGVQVRAYLGASVSAADTTSDAIMIHQFYKAGDTGIANSLFAMVCANLAFQMIVVWIQTHNLKKRRRRAMLLEFLSVVTFIKPGVDAYRVASGTEQVPGAAVTPLQELVYTKCGELFFEAVPGLVLQLVALLNAQEWTSFACTSIVISTLSTAMTVTTMFLDIDTDPGVKKRNPDWNGLIPDLGRGRAFFTVLVMSALQVIAKATATALLAVTKSRWLVGYIVGDHALHLIYRIARRDLV
jgi:hypothetical protein